MNALALQSFHRDAGGHLAEWSGQEWVRDYGSVAAEHAALRGKAGLIDLSFRGRLCLTGEDRIRFLHGQVTNDVKGLAVGQGCYAALTTAKGKMVSDLNIYRLEHELLLDFEPGLVASVRERLEHHIIADDVQVIDAAPHYGLLSVQGPKALDAVAELNLVAAMPQTAMSFAVGPDDGRGELYVVNLARTGTAGVDLYVPLPELTELATRLRGAVEKHGGRLCGWQAVEAARIEMGIPRFGADMDASNLPPEAGLEARAISYSKGCYIGQEVIARLRTYGQVTKALRGLRLADGLADLPERGDRLFKDGKEVGWITSVLASAEVGGPIALGYVRREANGIGTELLLQSNGVESAARIVELPFVQKFA